MQIEIVEYSAFQIREGMKWFVGLSLSFFPIHNAGNTGLPSGVTSN